MRIGLVCPYDLSKPGGVQSQVNGLAGQLRTAGDEVTIIGPGLPEGTAGVDLGPTITVPGNRSKVPLSVDPRVSGTIRREAGDLDLLHVHEPFMPVVSLSALRAGPPVVATFHAAPGAVAMRLYSLFRSQQRRLLGPNVHRVTAVSNTAAAPLADEIEVSIVPNGVDVPRFDADVDRHPGRVAFLGRDEKRKGLDVLLQAWDRVSETIPDVELVVMGADRGLEGITWMGAVDEAAKVAGLNSAAVYVAPNLGGESFGVVLVEGMAAGCAVVASDLGSFREVGGEAVRYFHTGDPGGLADALIDLMGDSTAVGALAAAGIERSRRFDWKNVTAQYRSVYEEALS